MAFTAGVKNPGRRNRKRRACRWSNRPPRKREQEAGRRTSTLFSPFAPANTKLSTRRSPRLHQPTIDFRPALDERAPIGLALAQVDPGINDPLVVAHGVVRDEVAA